MTTIDSFQIFGRHTYPEDWTFGLENERIRITETQMKHYSILFCYATGAVKFYFAASLNDY